MVDDMGIKMLPRNSHVVGLCDGYVKYEEGAVDKLEIMQEFRDNEKKKFKMAASGPFWISFLRNLSWVISV